MATRRRNTDPESPQPSGALRNFRTREVSGVGNRTPTPTERRLFQDRADAEGGAERSPPPKPPLPSPQVPSSPATVSLEADNENGEDPPEEFLCPITRDLMSDPVMLGTGQTYERKSIQQWMKDGKQTCPVTGQTLVVAELTPNFALRHAIQRWAHRHSIALAPPEPMPSPRPTIVGPPRQPGAAERLPPRTSPIMQAVVQLFSDNATVQEAAALKVCQIANEGGETGRIEALNAGAIPIVVSLLTNGNPSLQQVACKAIRFLARSHDPRVTVAASCAIPCLAKLLIHGNITMRQLAAGALVNLSAKTDSAKFLIAVAGAIRPLVAMLNPQVSAGCPNAQEVASAALCNLAVDEENRIEIASAGAIPLLVEVARTKPTPEAGEYAAHALGSLSCENEINTLAIVHSGAIPVLVNMAEAGTSWAQEAAARALRNLSYVQGVKPMLISGGVVEPLSKLTQQGSQRASDAATTALNNLRPLLTPRLGTRLTIQVPNAS